MKLSTIIVKIGAAWLLLGLLCTGCDGESAVEFGSSSSTTSSQSAHVSSTASSSSSSLSIASRSSISSQRSSLASSQQTLSGWYRKVDHTGAFLNEISSVSIQKAKTNLHIVYQHTSHGSQLITGMNALAGFPDFDNLYSWSDSGKSGLDLDDLGIPADASDLSQGDRVDGNGDTPWVVGTRALLNNPANSHVNVVIWSWCSINGHNVQRYLDNMEKLISEYPDVVFVFMTGHAEGLGEDLSVNGVHYNNELIRAHAQAHNRWLFDFADIEGYDPDGNYYWNSGMQDNLDYNDGNWAVEWMQGNPQHAYYKLTTGEGVDNFDGTYGCAHSNYPQSANLNCVIKGAAAWNLFGRIAEEKFD